MSKFLDELTDDCIAMRVGFIKNNPNDFYAGYEGGIKRIDSLSENARHMLEIGIVQDRLVELGFRATSDKLIPQYLMRVKEVLIDCSFQDDMATLYEPIAGAYGFYYTSPTWQDDLIDKVKGLIECYI